jgi:curved DNA-binding protein CbpA
VTHYRQANHYELLEVEPDATPADIEEAYKRQQELLSGETIATYGLFVGDDLLGLRQRVEDAYRVLSDPARRRAYDASGYAEPFPEVAPEPETPPELPPTPADEEAAGVRQEAEAPPMPEGADTPPETPPESVEAGELASAPEPEAAPSPEAEAPEGVPVEAGAEGYDGASLRAVRERNGVTLDSISARTKIAEYYLSYIEEERFDALPPPIYLRSYLKQYAAAIGIDPDPAVENYLARYNDAKGKR